MTIYRGIKAYIESKRVLLIIIQLVMSGVVIGVLSWNLATLLKSVLLKDAETALYTWTYIFYHPQESNLANYMLLSVGMGLYGLYLYVRGSMRKIEPMAEKAVTLGGVALLAVHLVFLFFLDKLSASARIFAASFLLATAIGFYAGRFKIITGKGMLFLSPWILLFVISIEPLSYVVGPAYLMNEYEDIYGVTRINGRWTSNKGYLDDLKDTDVSAVLTFYDLKYRYDTGKNMTLEDDNIDFLRGFRKKNLRIVQDYLVKMFGTSKVSSEPLSKEEEEYERHLNSLRNISVEDVKEFYLKNELEYSHQNMSRGQINHIGHVLNPIGEYKLGKPLRQIYMQYGLGNTFLMMWTMQLFGGVTIENYYKCYIFYVIYFLSFLLMLHVLFKDRLYILGAFAILAASHFMYSYIGFVLAPGIIPSIHFFDAAIVIFLALFLKSENKRYLFGIASLTVAGVLLNRQFGSMAALSLLVSFFVYAIENKRGKYRYWWLGGSAAVFALSFFAYKILGLGTSDSLFRYYLLGFFSWPAKPLIVLFTVIYFPVTYMFLLFLKDDRSYLKYIFIFVFMYVQGLFFYYYWSGLANHMPMVMPFLGLQMFLMMLMAKEAVFKNNGYAVRLLDLAKAVISAVALIAMSYSLVSFYEAKWQYGKNFRDHRTYRWRFEAANVVSTIDPVPVEESVSLIKKYGDKAGIFILSKYGNLLPFLSDRYSVMPHFELAWYLFSEKQHVIAVEKIRKEMPEYLFVDTDIELAGQPDPWAKIYNNDWAKRERTSRIGRYDELKKVFDEVAPDYEPVERGQLITVYRRKPDGS